jgi:DNA-binding response OmpR family regulator
VCRRLRGTGSIPIIMLTARSDDFDVVAGLEAGADDYVAKPVQPRVLDARIKAVLRRIASVPAPREQYGPLVIDRASLVVTKDSAVVDLTPTELRLLLASRAARGGCSPASSCCSPCGSRTGSATHAWSTAACSGCAPRSSRDR